MMKNAVAVCVGLACLVAGSQYPEFAQQYRQRLGGAVDESRHVEARFLSDANAAGLAPDAAVARMRGSGDDLVRRRGDSEQARRDRLARLEAHQKALAEDGAMLRLWRFAWLADGEVAKGTWSIYEPAVPVTSEGFIIGGAGFLAGYGATWLALWPVGRRRRAPPVSDA